MTKELTLTEKIAQHLFKESGDAAAYLDEREMEIKKRWAAIYTKMLDEPLTAHKDLVTFIVGGGMGAFTPVCKATAYRDIEAIQVLLGNIKTASKTWVRHLVYEHLLWAIKTAKDKNSVKGVVMAADKLAKYFKLDKDELDQMDWNAFPQPNFEPSSDPALLNIAGETIANYEERRKKLRHKLRIDAEDVVFTEVKNGNTA